MPSTTLPISSLIDLEITSGTVDPVPKWIRLLLKRGGIRP